MEDIHKCPPAVWVVVVVRRMDGPDYDIVKTDMQSEGHQDTISAPGDPFFLSSRTPHREHNIPVEANDYILIGW